jgi:hypothetical protein
MSSVRPVGSPSSPAANATEQAADRLPTQLNNVANQFGKRDYGATAISDGIEGGADVLSEVGLKLRNATGSAANLIKKAADVGGVASVAFNLYRLPQSVRSIGDAATAVSGYVSDTLHGVKTDDETTHARVQAATGGVDAAMSLGMATVNAGLLAEKAASLLPAAAEAGEVAAATTAARAAASTAGRWAGAVVPYVNAAFLATDTANAIMTTRDPKTSTGEKIAAWTAVAGTGIATAASLLPPGLGTIVSAGGTILSVGAIAVQGILASRREAAAAPAPAPAH